MAKKTTMTAEELLADHIPPMREIAERLRAIVRDEVPGVEERIHRGWHSFSYLTAKTGLFAGIFPREEHVTIAWEWGILLDDHERILTGTELKRMRYHQIFDPDAIPEAAIRDLLRQAIALERPTATGGRAGGRRAGGRAGEGGASDDADPDHVRRRGRLGGGRVAAEDQAPKTCAAVLAALPQAGEAHHATYSGSEVAFILDRDLGVGRENATSKVIPGDLAYTRFDGGEMWGFPDDFAELCWFYDRDAVPSMPDGPVPVNICRPLRRGLRRVRRGLPPDAARRGETDRGAGRVGFSRLAAWTE